MRIKTRDVATEAFLELIQGRKEKKLDQIIKGYKKWIYYNFQVVFSLGSNQQQPGESLKLVVKLMQSEACGFLWIAKTKWNLITQLMRLK